jgi:hypothetical protein
MTADPDVGSNLGSQRSRRARLRVLIAVAAMMLALAPMALVDMVLADIALAEPTFQHNVDMKGFDYANFDLPRPSAKLCQQSCLNDERCRSWVYVRPTQFGPRATCWLKSRVPDGQASTCCDSGTR